MKEAMKKDPHVLSVRHLAVKIARNLGRSNEIQVDSLITDLSMDIPQGKITALLGESGAGKSVFAQTILGLLPSPPFLPPTGEIWFEEQNLLSLEEKKMRKIRGQKIAMVFQEPKSALNPVMTIGDQLSEMLPQKAPSEIKDRVLTGLQEVQLQNPKKIYDSYPHELSGGMLQRALIAMSLLGDPKLIIADEPTTALDVTIQAEILSLLLRLKEEKKLSILLITHDLGVVAEIAENLFVLYDGQIVEKGSSISVFDHPAHPYTAELFNSRYFNPQNGPLKPKERVHSEKGCRFFARCPFAMDCCRDKIPPFFHLANREQSVRCMLYDPDLETKISYEEDDIRD